MDICELSVAQVGGLLVLEPLHPGLFWHGCSLFLRFIQGFNSAILLVVGDVSVDNEAHMVTLSISIFAGLTQFFRSARRDRVCVCAFIGVSVRSCM
jgi:hypothetical protein